MKMYNILANIVRGRKKLPFVRADHLRGGVESHLPCPEFHQSLKRWMTFVTQTCVVQIVFVYLQIWPSYHLRYKFWNHLALPSGCIVAKKRSTNSHNQLLSAGKRHLVSANPNTCTQLNALHLIGGCILTQGGKPLKKVKKRGGQRILHNHPKSTASDELGCRLNVWRQTLWTQTLTVHYSFDDQYQSRRLS